ncbi:hypothetical protein VitviT2T_016897 [Vitis vinifera]|uniref:CCHC-type domain-containing protein n=1 Tax=Vitis vinifera TaxID=29760 RepID=A0ABY9CTB7_VITVI|nr:hypothetical protein VitviT2T_016897 [Vitis vinifera]
MADTPQLVDFLLPDLSSDPLRHVVRDSNPLLRWPSPPFSSLLNLLTWAAIVMRCSCREWRKMKSISSYEMMDILEGVKIKVKAKIIEGNNARRSKSIVDEDLNDLKACIELGFGFDSPNVDSLESDDFKDSTANEDDENGGGRFDELNSISSRFSNDPFSSFRIIQMANTNDTSIPVSILPPSTTIISVKLDGSHNYLAWKMQFLNLLRGHDLMGFIDGTEACPPKHIASGSLNPAYVVWQKKDTRFSSQSRSRISHLKRQLQTLTQGTKSCSEYLESAKTLADQLAAGGKPVDDQDLISFLLGGLQSSYTPFFTSFNFASRETDFTFEDFQAELLGYENLLDVNHSVHNTDGPHFAFAANKSKAPTYVQKKGPPLPPTKMQNAASSNYRSQQTRSTPPQLPNNRPVCQICGKSGHTAIDCFHRFDYSYQGRFPPQDLAAMVAETNATFDHQVWYMDSGANAHITSDAFGISAEDSDSLTLVLSLDFTNLSMTTLCSLYILIMPEFLS